MTSFSEEILVFALAVTSCVAGFIVTVVGFGFAVVPPTIPIFRAAANSVSLLYVLIGIVLIMLGGGVLVLRVSEVIRLVGSGSNRGHR